MNAIQKRVEKLKIPLWMPWTYGIISLSLIPWIIYLQITLPTWQGSLPWRAMWIGFDVALLVTSSVATYLLSKKSPWAGFILALFGALLAADIWFDMMTSSIAANGLQTILLDVCVELPLALFTLWSAFYLWRQVIAHSSRSNNG